jgi:hypothetical protein
VEPQLAQRRLLAERGGDYCERDAGDEGAVKGFIIIASTEVQRLCAVARRRKTTENDERLAELEAKRATLWGRICNPEPRWDVDGWAFGAFISRLDTLTVASEMAPTVTLSLNDAEWLRSWGSE